LEERDQFTPALGLQIERREDAVPLGRSRDAGLSRPEKGNTLSVRTDQPILCRRRPIATGTDERTAGDHPTHRTQKPTSSDPARMSRASCVRHVLIPVTVAEGLEPTSDPCVQGLA
jgi:hypothetical protein